MLSGVGIYIDMAGSIPRVREQRTDIPLLELRRVACNHVHSKKPRRLKYHQGFGVVNCLLHKTTQTLPPPQIDTKGIGIQHWCLLNMELHCRPEIK